MNLYTLLGIDNTAANEDIKRAYFRMVRKHTPENDPETFKRIRNAYETLSDAKSRAEYDMRLSRFPDVPDEAVAYILESERLRAMGRMEEAGNLLMSKKYGDKAAEFARQAALCETYMADRKYGYAVKIADKLAKENPKNAAALMLAIKAYTLRGWAKKADSYKRALDMIDPGNEENSIVMLNDDYASLRDIADIVENAESHGKKAPMACLKILCNHLGGMLDDDDLHDSPAVQLSFKDIAAPDRRNWNDLSYAAKMLAIHTEGVTEEKRVTVIEALDEFILRCIYSTDRYEILPFIESVIKNAGVEKMLEGTAYKTLLAGYQAQAAVRSGMPKALAALPAMRAFSASDFCPRNDRKDCQNEAVMLETEILCDYLRYKPYIKRLKNEHPDLYTHSAGFYNEIQQYNEAKLIKAVESRLAKTRKFDERLTLDWLGEDDDEADSVRREPVRSDKIGRNEPCPCGSGKKYKKCCGA